MTNRANSLAILINIEQAFIQKSIKRLCKYKNRHFWAEGYGVSTVELNEATIRKYIQEQEKHDITLDKLSVRE